MTNSATTPPAASPSSTTTTTPVNPPAASQPLKVPPLRVSSPTPSTATPTDVPGGAAADPLDNAATGSTRSSEPATTAVKVDKNALTDIARNAVLVLSKFVHDVLARTEEEQAADVWIAEPRDQSQIGDPLASIATRHGAPATAASPDVAELVAAGIGLVAYLTKNAAKAWQIRRGRRKVAAVDPINEHPEEQQ